MFSQGTFTSIEITCSAKWTAAITYVDRHPFKNQRKPLINVSQSTTRTQVLFRERERETKKEKKQSLRCNLCKWALLNLLANGKWFSTADWLIGPWHGGVCCSVSSPWHCNHRKHTLPCCLAVHLHPLLHTAAITGVGGRVRRVVVDVGGCQNKPSLI